jgi:hypothetical protein
MTTANEILLCPVCFDRHRCSRIYDFVQRATCSACGCRGLGYLTEIPPSANAANSQDDDIENRRRA